MRNIKDINFAMVQMDTITGDIIGNYTYIKNKIVELSDKGAEIIVFPETSISGYCCGSLWDNVEFIQEQENLVKNISNIIPHNVVIVLGYISFHGIKKNGLPRLKNSVAVINNGNLFTYDKQLLANTDHHEDKKYFDPGIESKVFEVQLKDIKLTIGVPICEDIWFTDHIRNIPKEMKDLGAEILICCNQSYFYYEKQKVRRKLVTDISKNLNIPVIYVNNVGVGDIVKNIIIYDGGSLACDKGEVVTEFDQFKIQSEIFKLNDEFTNGKLKGKINTTKYDDIYNSLIFTMKNYLELQGIKKVQLHLSGGLDSSVVAVLMAKTVGPENCIFITNPSTFNSDATLKNVDFVCEKLGVKLYTNPIEDIYQKILDVDKDSFGDELNIKGKTTIHATLRSCLALYNCHRFGTSLVSTTNHTESVLGWSTYLDISYAGIFSPIGDLSKIECYELSKYINERFGELIPKNLYDGTVIPSPELPDAPFSDNIDYFIQSGLCAEVVRNHKGRNELIKNFVDKKLTPDFFTLTDDGKSIYDLYDLTTFIKEVDFTLNKISKSVFKCAQMPPVILLNKRSRGFSSRETLINKYK